MPQPTPNLHHLELFYHVVSSGGITAATRTMPYGIQQPAVSGQIATLEKELGIRLFQRRPFAVTPAGQELFDFVAPFFSRLPLIASRIAGKASSHLRLAAPALLIREHLPDILAKLRKKQPDMELSLVEAGQRHAIELLESEKIDLAITELDATAPTGTSCEILVSLPLVLLHPTSLKISKPNLKEIATRFPLIRPPANTAVSRLFAKGLETSGIRWQSRIEVSTIDLVQTYVSRGFGLGVSVTIPGIPLLKSLKSIPLTDFPPLQIAGLWRGTLHPLARLVLNELKTRAKS